MARKTEVPDLADDDMVRMLETAVEDEREGRLVRCGDETELRALMEHLQHERP